MASEETTRRKEKLHEELASLNKRPALRDTVAGKVLMHRIQAQIEKLERLDP